MTSAPTAPALRQRLYRQRQRDGGAVFPVEVGPAVVEALLVAGRLSDAGSRDRDEVRRALAGVLDEWATRWLKESVTRNA